MGEDSETSQSELEKVIHTEYETAKLVFDDGFINEILSIVYQKKSHFIRMSGKSQAGQKYSGQALIRRIMDHVLQIKKDLKDGKKIKLLCLDEENPKYRSDTLVDNFDFFFFPYVADDLSNSLEVEKFHALMSRSLCEKARSLVLMVVDPEDKFKELQNCQSIDLAYFLDKERLEKAKKRNY